MTKGKDRSFFLDVNDRCFDRPDELVFDVFLPRYTRIAQGDTIQMYGDDMKMSGVVESIDRKNYR